MFTVKFSVVNGILATLAFGLVMASVPVMAQEKFPSRPIEIVVGTPAGGGTDAVARRLAELVEPMLGQKVVVSNKPGAGGMVGIAAVTHAKADGYTLAVVWPGPTTMTPHTQPAPYSPDDYTPIVLTDIQPGVLCVKPEMPANNGKEFLELLRKNPNKFTYGNDGVAGMMHFSSERIFVKVGVKARAVPFGGAGETLKNFLGGHVDIYSGSIAPILPYVKAGAAKCLLLTSKEKNDAMPQATSLTELGVPEVATNLFHGVIGPKGIPADRFAVLEKAFIQASQSDKFRALMAASGGIIPTGQQGAVEFRKFIDSEYAAMRELTKTMRVAK